MGQFIFFACHEQQSLLILCLFRLIFSCEPSRNRIWLPLYRYIYSCFGTVASQTVGDSSTRKYVTLKRCDHVYHLSCLFDSIGILLYISIATSHMESVQKRAKVVTSSTNRAGTAGDRTIPARSGNAHLISFSSLSRHTHPFCP